MASSRFKRGYQLFKDGLVECTHEDNECAMFNVRSRSRKDQVHEVTVYDDCVLCTCEDFHNRHLRKGDATFLCQHGYGALASMFHTVGMTTQATFEIPTEHRVRPPRVGVNVVELQGSDWEGK